MQVVRQETQPIIINLQVGERGKVEKEEAEMILLVGSKSSFVETYRRILVFELHGKQTLRLASAFDRFTAKAKPQDSLFRITTREKKRKKKQSIKKLVQFPTGRQSD